MYPRFNPLPPFIECQLAIEGLGMSLEIMGLAAIAPHIYKVQTKLYKIPKFGLNRP